ncbi:MAG: c-type cytochrome biogenesis protein CcmI, partial [Pseudomonadota bacterium]
TAARPGATAQAAAPVAPAASAGPVLRGTVRLAPALAAQAKPEDTVFVFARPAEGSRMPLAIVRKQVKDLPLEFALDDRLAMTPAARLSLHPKVVVDARVSKSGQAQPSAGDLAGRTGIVANDATGLVVEINEVVKP